MLDHSSYDKIKLLHELSSIVWFIEKHAKLDAKNSGDMECHDFFEQLAEDLEEYIHELQHMICEEPAQE
jgi:hypothetical protein